MEIEANGSGEIFIAFDERELKTGFECLRSSRIDVISIKLEGGKYSFVSAEPYVFKYMRIVAKGTAVKIRAVRHISIAYPASKVKASFIGEDEEVKLIYDAAVNTFRDNTVDIYMDCPSRERAGWLCDSFFTSRVEKTLTGDSAVEKAYLYNFLYQEQDPHLPEGMLPMCYPSDHNDTKYIPNWAMWFVVELEEYLQRSSDRALVDACRDRVYALLGFLKTFENNEGLLSKLESWVFIEWSESNKLTQDISFPSNMLYCKFKRCIAKLYGDEKLSKEADELAETIRNYSFMGDFFCDNAVYDASGEPVLSGKCTESCQYYAFFTDIATPELYPELWDTLVNDFGPERKETRKWERIPFANAFIGNYLRLELLYRYGLYDKVTENIRGYFEMMADKTGTLWENDTTCASCNHGFASHVIYWLCGIYNK
jgi:alpha-L-rhamnosidase